MGELAYSASPIGGAITVVAAERSFHFPPLIAKAIRTAVTRHPVSAIGLLLGVGDREIQVTAAWHGEISEDRNAFAALSSLIEEASEGQGSVRPVGWYSVRKCGELRLGASDYEVHSQLFLDQDLVLLCELTDQADVRFVAKSGVSESLKTRASAWAWPMGIAFAFAALFLAAAGFRKSPDSPVPAVPQAIKNVHSASAVTQPLASSPSEVPANSRTEAVEHSPVRRKYARSAAMERELAFQKAHSRRLEATLRILRERANRTEKP